MPVLYEKITKKDPVTKGWSGEQKFKAVMEDGHFCLLRVSPERQLEKRQYQFSAMERWAALDIPMCRPLEFGVCKDGVYSLQSWIEGHDAEDVLHDCPFIHPLLEVSLHSCHAGRGYMESHDNRCSVRL